MNRKPLVVLAAAATICIAFTTGFALAAARALDPALLAPHIYEVLLENERVRVLQVTERNGETPPLHSHPDRVVVYLSPCAWLEPDADGAARMQSHKFGGVQWATATTHGGETSSVIQECRILEIELKPPR